ncbi:retropepsin-like domain-containing protein [Vulcanisaeta sp. JCM 16159]|uniref:retropepsin-like domain-containing protein n=1 Tax=Vulcanisaeta sp. JCM 16159 TaxID=1295371 RepID=UPI000A9BB48F|nr:retropepsin-like domain-containing protein [Vulcanisaeta sp. JCM 16159]
MGDITARVRLCNPRDSSRCLELDLLVDTGSTYTWIKASRLRELGIEPMRRWRFRTIEGRIIERDLGEAIIECMGKRATTIVVFA